MSRKCIAEEVLIDLSRQLEGYPKRDPARRQLIQHHANLYGISESTLYRQLAQLKRPKAAKRCDAGQPRCLDAQQMHQYCDLIAALKLRTTNKKGRHLSTTNAILLLEKTGIHSQYGFVQAPKGLLNKTTVNRYLAQYGLDKSNLIKNTPAVRFQASYSNECWQFDLSPSDLKAVKEPLWYDKSKGLPMLMLYSVVDDRSGVCYQEYRNVHGEDAGHALLFLFNAMSAKADPDNPFQGIPKMIYMDNGPISKSRVFRQVMHYLGIEVKTHLPDSKDKHRKTARSKGKVERAFRTVKECHEVLYHLREPKNEVEANQMLSDYLNTYNDHQHRHESHSRMADWCQHIDGKIKSMCSWERFCAFAREPEKRKVGIDAQIHVEGSAYEVNPELAGEQVVLWWGLFDDELYVEHQAQRYGPYFPVTGPIPLSRYRKFKKNNIEQRLEQLETLADSLTLPESKENVTGEMLLQPRPSDMTNIPTQAFVDPDPFHEKCYLNQVQAKVAISKYLGKPLSLLSQSQKEKIDEILQQSLEKEVVMSAIKTYFNHGLEGENHAT